MPEKRLVIPAIDLFAGPGGLSEGFSRCNSNGIRFDIRLSIEKDVAACETLALRSFTRQFNGRKLPQAYYDYVRGNREAFSAIYSLPEWNEAERHIRQWTLGEGDPAQPGYVAPEILHETIHGAVGGASHWVLLGGPPCQAYSIVGRSRMTGVGSTARQLPNSILNDLKARRHVDFLTDHRHTLYREYLRVVAVHQPPFFVMENVKGILSAKLPKRTKAGPERMFDQIRQDLSDPWKALAEDPDHDALRTLRARFGQKERRYVLRPFVKPNQVDVLNDVRNSDFLIQAEKFGIPQRRHRVIVLGVRSDLAAKLSFEGLRPSDLVVPLESVLRDMPPIRSALSRQRATKKKYGEDSAIAWCRALSEEVQAAAPDVADHDIKKGILGIGCRDATPLSTGRGFVPSTDILNGAPPELRNWMIDPRLDGVLQHRSRGHMASDLARYLYLSVAAANSLQGSPKLDQWPKALLPKHANVRHARGHTDVDGFLDRFRVQTWHQPSSTITSHLHKDGHYFIHPDPEQCRSLTVREAARLQTFPENYYFEGSQTEQFIQVGNAVPPYLGQKLAQYVAMLMNQIKVLKN